MWIYNRIHHQPYYHHHYYFAKLSLPFNLGFGDKAAFVSPKVNSFLSLFRSAAPLDLSLWIPPERRIGRNLNQIKQWGTGVKNNLLIYHVAMEETGLWGLLRQTVINVPWVNAFTSAAPFFSAWHISPAPRRCRIPWMSLIPASKGNPNSWIAEI